MLIVLTGCSVSVTPKDTTNEKSSTIVYKNGDCQTTKEVIENRSFYVTRCATGVGCIETLCRIN
jgi:hypothetical protein